MWHWLFNTQAGFVILLVAGVLVGLVIYVLPMLLAWSMGSPFFWKITLLDLLLGWTVLGWIAALVWAATSADDITFD